MRVGIATDHGGLDVDTSLDGATAVTSRPAR